MEQHMTKNVSALLDPRGYQDRKNITLAKRPSLDELKKGKILFYNNTKLGFCNYYTVFDRIKERLREIGCDDSKWVEYTETVRGKNAEKLGEYAAMLAKENPVAAIVAFGDMGTSSSTTVVTIALENLGIPAVYMTAPPGTGITEGVGVYRAGNLCLCSVDIYQGSTVEEVAAQVDLKWDYILGSLTENGDKLLKLAPIDFKMDKVPPQKDGLLPFIPSFDDEKAGEPGAYMEEVMEFFNKEHICDGLPIFPPTKAPLREDAGVLPLAREHGTDRSLRPQWQRDHREGSGHLRHHGRLHPQGHAHSCRGLQGAQQPPL
jgi:hypothetical protein